MSAASLRPSLHDEPSAAPSVPGLPPGYAPVSRLIDAATKEYLQSLCHVAEMSNRTGWQGLADARRKLERKSDSRIRR